MTWPTCFSRAKLARLFAEYEHVARCYPGFSLTEIREWSPRERDFWFDMTNWRNKHSSK